MRRAIVLCALIALACGPAAAGARSAGYDWMLGTWICKNSLPNAIVGPAVQTLTATRSATTGGIIWRYTGKAYDQYGFLSNVSKTGTWWQSWALPGGSIGNESSKQSGTVSHWTGMIWDTSTGKSYGIRDTLTIVSPTKFNDIGEAESSGSWKVDYNGTCTKT